MKKSLAFLFLVPFTLFGENLAELVELSKNNKMIDASAKGLDASIAEYGSVKSSYLPSINVGATYEMTDKETSSMPDNKTVLYGQISYTIYDGGKRSDTYDMYENTIKSSSQSLENTKNQIALQVVNYYYTYLSLVAQKEAKIKEIEQLKAQQERLERFLDAGTTTADEVQLIISNVESANVALHEIELNIQTILHNLEYTVGSPVSINVGSSISEFTSDEETLRADIQALEYDMKALLANASAQKSGYYPTVTIADTMYQYDLNYESDTYSAYTADYSQNVATLSLTWNLFSFGATNKSYEAAYQKYLALKSQYEYEKNKASVDLRLAKKAYAIAKLKIGSAKAGLNAANSAYDAIKAKYQNGLVDNVAYLGALSQKIGAESALKSAQYDLEIKKANIIYYNGKNIEEFIQ